MIPMDFPFLLFLKEKQVWIKENFEKKIERAMITIIITFNLFFLNVNADCNFHILLQNTVVDKKKHSFHEFMD